jgi:TRAP-type mannitol/chloroaromatic compound transport system substrate-binding protein
MAEEPNVSPRALLLAVVTALAVGVVGSLALRPPGAGHAGGAAAARTDGGFETVRWRVTSSFTSVMPVIGISPLRVSDSVREVSNGAINLEFFEPGEIVPALEITEAVRDRKVQAGFMWVGYDQGRIPASTLISAVPFGMEPTEFAAWWYYGGGQGLGEALYHEHNVQPVLCHLIGPETAGWFREPITALEDLDGLKIRFAGLGGKVLQRLGASVTMIPGGEIFQALEKGAIDASEFSLPIVDRMLGFGRVAPYNYFPGWHQTFTTGHLLINLDAWNELEPRSRALIELACRSEVTLSLAEGEAVQGEIIRNFAGEGISAESLSPALLQELRRVSNEVLDEEAAKDEHFARILASQRSFSETYGYWKRKAYLPRDF